MSFSICAVSSGVRRLHPHLLRHTYATWFLLNGGDVFLLKQNLGHKTLAMVEYYIHMASRDVAIRSQAFSPLDGFGVDGGRRYRHPSSATREPGGIYPQSGLNKKNRPSVKHNNEKGNNQYYW